MYKITNVKYRQRGLYKTVDGDQIYKITNNGNILLIVEMINEHNKRIYLPVDILYSTSEEGKRIIKEKLLDDFISRLRYQYCGMKVPYDKFYHIENGTNYRFINPVTKNIRDSIFGHDGVIVSINYWNYLNELYKNKLPSKNSKLITFKNKKKLYINDWLKLIDNYIHNNNNLKIY